MEYAIKAKPTEYKGRLYRSRLESRWAAFFDIMNWEYEYEPFDLHKWSPDFLIENKILVEIKPFNTLEEFRKAGVVQKIIDSNVQEKEYRTAFLGLTPSKSMEGIKIGWILCSNNNDRPWEDELSVVSGYPFYGVSETLGSWRNIFNNNIYGKDIWNIDTDDVKEKWQQAANCVMFLNPTQKVNEAITEEFKDIEHTQTYKLMMRYISDPVFKKLVDEQYKKYTQ